MNIVTWNCNGALREKTGLVESLYADILVIQECEDPGQSTRGYQAWAGSYLWVGTSKNKGIGIFPKNGHRIKPLNWSGEFRISGLNSKSASTSWKTADLNLFLPFCINDKYTVLAAWTKGSDSEAFGYVGQFWKYLQIHRKELSKPDTLILGDLNSNAIWDKPDRWWSHTDVVNELKGIGFESLYHLQKKEEQGNESLPTFFMHRNEMRPYHIDYAFASSNLQSKSRISVGEKSEWLSASDHMPLSINIST